MQSCIFATDCAHLPADAGGARALKRTLVLSPLFRSSFTSDAGTEIHCNGCTLHYFNQPGLWLQLHLVHCQGAGQEHRAPLVWLSRWPATLWRLRAQGHQQRSTTLREEEPWNFILHPDPDWGRVASSAGKYLSVQQKQKPLLGSWYFFDTMKWEYSQHIIFTSNNLGYL